MRASRSSSGSLAPSAAFRLLHRSLSARSTEADRLGKFRALGGVAGGDHWVVGRQAEAGPVAVGVEFVRREVALQRLVGLAVEEADQGIRRDRLADLRGRRLLNLVNRG